MRTIFGHGAAISASAANCDPDRALIVTRQLLVFPRRYYLTVLAALAFVVVALPGKEFPDVSQLERLAPRIERAQTLSPETRDLIGRLVVQHDALAGSGDSSQDLRRKAAIERVTSAMKAKVQAKETSTVASGEFRPPQD
jgi:hypothetical protein